MKAFAYLVCWSFAFWRLGRPLWVITSLAGKAMIIAVLGMALSFWFAWFIWWPLANYVDPLELQWNDDWEEQFRREKLNKLCPTTRKTQCQN